MPSRPLTFAGDSGARRIDARSLPLDWEPLPPEQVVEGDPRVGASPISTVAGVEVGLWAHTTGVSTDVEADEVFVVLSGRATIEIDDGTVLEVGPGDVGVLPPGAVTRWTIHEDLRKVYVIRTDS